MTPVSLPDELVLIAYDDDTGRPAPTHLDTGVGAAVMIELFLAARLGLSGELVTVVDAQPTGDPILDEVLALVGSSEPAKLADWLTQLGHKGYHLVVRDRLVERGWLRKEAAKLLWVIHWDKYPAGSDGGAEADARARIRAALETGRAADTRTAALCGLVGATQLESSLFDKRRSVAQTQAVRDNLLALASEEPVVGATASAVDAAVQAAVLATTAALTAVMVAAVIVPNT